MHLTNVEALRLSFRPASVRILLVGESPPASGDFFYRGGAMTTYTARAFERAFAVSFPSTDLFLAHFRDCGCYLEDISRVPVDTLPRRERRGAVEDCVPDFARRVRELRPKVIVGILKSIEQPLRESVNLSGLSVPVHVLPFPGHSHQARFVDGLARILTSCGCRAA